MNKTPLIKIENVWKIYQLGKIELPVLKGVSLEVARGSFVSIMGPSGSGKSSLLHILSCLDTPTKGSVFLEDKDVSNLPKDELAGIRNRKIGFVFQRFNLLPNFNALGNVAFPMVFQGIKEAVREKNAKEILASVGLKNRLLHRPNELSGGEQQRVAIARALANNPEIIVADEPTGSVDSRIGKQIMEILTKLHQEHNKTIIMVTHDYDIAKQYSQRVINIKDGLMV